MDCESKEPNGNKNVLEQKHYPGPRYMWLSFIGKAGQIGDDDEPKNGSEFTYP